MDEFDGIDGKVCTHKKMENVSEVVSLGPHHSKCFDWDGDEGPCLVGEDRGHKHSDDDIRVNIVFSRKCFLCGKILDFLVPIDPKTIPDDDKARLGLMSGV